MKFVAHNSTKSPFLSAMAPQHSFLFDKPFRFVLGMGITAGTVWALFKPTDVALAEEVMKPHTVPHASY